MESGECEIDIFPDLTEGDVVTVHIKIPEGLLWVMGKLITAGRRITLEDMHIHGEGFGVNALGLGRLRTLAQEVMEKLDVDEAMVFGAKRSTGANPGHRPRGLRFTRKTALKAIIEGNEHAQGGPGLG